MANKRKWMNEILCAIRYVFTIIATIVLVFGVTYYAITINTDVQETTYELNFSYATDPGKITVFWDEIPNASHYEVYLKQADEVRYEKLGTVETTYVDIGGIRTGEYMIRVKVKETALIEEGYSQEFPILF